jgi:hypothetical protein
MSARAPGRRYSMPVPRVPLFFREASGCMPRMYVIEGEPAKIS